MRSRWSTLAVALMAAVSMAACGSAKDDGAQVASLGTELPTDGSGAPPDNTGDTSNTGDTGKADPEEAMLSYTQCMRDNGVDMPDPVVSRSGGGTVQVIQSGAAPGGGPGDGVDPMGDEFKAADKECRHFMDDVVSDIQIDPEQQAEMRQQMLDYSACMRDQGVDFPDPVFDDNGGVSVNVVDGGVVDQAAMEAATKACADIMGDGTFGVAVGSS